MPASRTSPLVCAVPRSRSDGRMTLMPDIIGLQLETLVFSLPLEVLEGVVEQRATVGRRIVTPDDGHEHAVSVSGGRGDQAAAGVVGEADFDAVRPGVV